MSAGSDQKRTKKGKTHSSRIPIRPLIQRAHHIAQLHTRITPTQHAIRPTSPIAPNNITARALLTQRTTPIIQQISNDIRRIRRLRREEAAERAQDALARVGVGRWWERGGGEEVGGRLRAGWVGWVRRAGGGVGLGGRFDECEVGVLGFEAREVVVGRHCCAVGTDVDEAISTKGGEVRDLREQVRSASGCDSKRRMMYDLQAIPPDQSGII